MVNYQRDNLLGTEPWTKPWDTGSLRAVIRLSLWGGRGASERADEVTSQHRGRSCKLPENLRRLSLILRHNYHRTCAALTSALCSDGRTSDHALQEVC